MTICPAQKGKESGGEQIEKIENSVFFTRRKSKKSKKGFYTKNREKSTFEREAAARHIIAGRIVQATCWCRARPTS